MNTFICRTCGVQYPESSQPPQCCSICGDERQYVGHEGQQWITPEELRREHSNRIEEVEPGLVGIGTEPRFAIGQRALLVRTPEGNLLWDCISLLDSETVATLERLGGIRAIAISHPHFYDSMVDWAEAFGAEVLLHADDSAHVMRPDPAIEFWEGETMSLFGGLTLVRLGGHFAGSSVLHWPAGAEGRGALLTGDTVMVVPDTRWVSFMYSYPNLIPLPPATVERMVAGLEPYQFDRIYAGWWDRVLSGGAKEAVHRSARRYIAALSD